MAMIEIRRGLFVNPQSIDVVDITNEGVIVVVGDREFQLEEASADKILEIKDSVSPQSDPKNIQHFGG